MRIFFFVCAQACVFFFMFVRRCSVSRGRVTITPRCSVGAGTVLGCRDPLIPPVTDVSRSPITHIHLLLRETGFFS